MVGMGRDSSDPSLPMTPQPEEWIDAIRICSKLSAKIALWIDDVEVQRKLLIEAVATALRQTAERAAERERERCAKVAKEHGEKWKSWQLIPSAIHSGQGEGGR